MRCLLIIPYFLLLLALSLYACGDDDDDNDDNDDQADDDATDDDSGDDDTTDDDADDDADDDLSVDDDDDTFVGTWWIDKVDDVQDSIDEFTRTSLQLDSAENPHIVYFHMGFHLSLMSATYNNGQWDLQQLFPEDEFYGFVSLGLDENDKAHFSIYQQIEVPLKYSARILSYATDEAGDWALTTVDPGSEFLWGTGQFNSLVLDSNEKVHISYQSGTGDTLEYPVLQYATNVSGDWMPTVIDYCPQTEGCAGFFSSLAIDNLDDVHIAHGGCDVYNDCLRYVTNVSGWHGECVPDTEDRTYQSSVAVDQNGVINIAFNRLYETTKHEQIHSLHFALKSGDEWTTEEIDSNISAKCRELSDHYLALDGAGYAHIAYTGLNDEDNPVLKYATNASGEWVTEIVDPSPNSGIGASIALDGEGYVHISYYDNGHSSLKYATNRP